MLFVCERVRKAAAHKRQPQRAKRAADTERADTPFRPRATTNKACQARNAASGASHRTQLANGGIVRTRDVDGGLRLLLEQRQNDLSFQLRIR